MTKNIVTDTLKNSEHWNGDEYAKISLPQYTINSEFLSRYTFSGDEKILDIGCGNGRTTMEMAIKVLYGEVLGIDASSSMIETARRENISNNINFTVLNAEKINFNNQFNVVSCFFCMQWVQNKKLTLQKIHDCLKLNGKFLMVVPMPHPHLSEIRNNLVKKQRWEGYFKIYQDPLIYVNDTSYEEYIKIAGLTSSYYQVEPTPVYFPDYISFFKFMSQMTPHLSCLLAEAEKIEFMHSLIEEYSKIYPPINGRYELVFNLLKVYAYRPTSKN